jgi:hypothetical protein
MVRVGYSLIIHTHGMNDHQKRYQQGLTAGFLLPVSMERPSHQCSRRSCGATATTVSWPADVKRWRGALPSRAVGIHRMTTYVYHHRPCNSPWRLQMKAGGSSFDSLGMPKIRPRGKGEEKTTTETPAVAEVAPVSRSGGGRKRGMV